MIKNHYSMGVKYVRMDIVNKNCAELFGELGIVHQRTCPYTPQQNGVMEQKHKRLLAVARSLMYSFGVPKCFWGECLLMVTYIINRLPSRILD